MTANLARAAAPSVEILRHAGVPQAQVAGPLGRLIILLAERYGLDPALKHVEVIPARGGPTVYITADGWRFIAERSGLLDGLTFENVERGEHGWRATALAWKKGCSHPFEGRAGCGFTEKADDPEAIAMTRATRRALRTGFASRITVPSELALFFSDTDAVPAPDVGDDLEGLVPDGVSDETLSAIRAQLDAEAEKKEKAALTPASTRAGVADAIKLDRATRGEWVPTIEDQTAAHKAVANLPVDERTTFLQVWGIDDFSMAFSAEAVAAVLAGPVGDVPPAGPAGNEP